MVLLFAVFRAAIIIDEIFVITLLIGKNQNAIPANRQAFLSWFFRYCFIVARAAKTVFRQRLKDKME
jgi:hypothetical protein